MNELTTLSLAQARDRLRKKDISARELAEALSRRHGKARALNAYVLETPERALAMAAESDARIAAGTARPLEGVPLGIKDMFCTEGRAHNRVQRASRRTSSRPTNRP